MTEVDPRISHLRPVARGSRAVRRHDHITTVGSQLPMIGEQAKPDFSIVGADGKSQHFRRNR